MALPKTKPNRIDYRPTRTQLEWLGELSKSSQVPIKELLHAILLKAARLALRNPGKWSKAKADRLPGNAKTVFGVYFTDQEYLPIKTLCDQEGKTGYMIARSLLQLAIAEKMKLQVKASAEDKAAS